MIEKPKRPKKIPNQDNKQPQTIQEIIRRYDLDNTKIYDFLDDLVGQINSKEAHNEKQINEIEKKVECTVLYEDTTGTNGTVTLSETSANFTYIEVYFHRENAYESSVKISNPNGKQAKLQEIGSTYIHFSVISFVEDVIETGGYSRSVQISDGASTSYDTNIFNITKVVGYR